jgi:YidC/Oxa1 family membrane protein insertase
LVIGNDTVDLANLTFQPSSQATQVRDSGTVLTWTGRRAGATVLLTYTFRPDHYLFDVSGDFSSVANRGLAIIGLGPRIAAVEADSVEDYRAYAVVTKANKTERLNFRSLDPATVVLDAQGNPVTVPGERRELSGPFEWVAVKSKYFTVAAMVMDEDQPRFGGAVATAGLASGKQVVRTDVQVSLPAPSGVFSYSVYVGPQEFGRLARIGHDFEDINPYGWVFRPIIQPFANVIVQILIWMHENLNLAYGWVLVLFGIAVRLVLWPLNQKAMRSSVAMQAVQPELKALQDRYKNDPQKLQPEMMKLYKEHGVNPLGGCLPMLIPMPVLFALFFVFRETIEFRGVPFLWLPDLSRADPLFIIPIVMGLSMYAVSKIGQMGVPPNPQAKMMLYVMPGVLTLLFLKFSAGLNLYYAVSNIASVPQQWLIAKDRMRRLGKR